jgi:hypothetical protein
MTSGEGRQRKGQEMRKLCLVASLAAVMAAPSLFASMSVTLLDNTSKYSYGNGGEFRAVGDAGLNNVVNWNAYSASTKGTIGAADVGSWGYNSGLAGKLYFQTFCIEDTEYFSPGSSYDASTSDRALYGHAGTSPGVPVTMGTAWLYSQFASGKLSGYNYSYGGGRQNLANAGSLQQAIWYFQGEGGAENSWALMAETAVGGKDAALAEANGAYGVRALNLFNGPYSKDVTVNGVTYHCNQDQLVIVPEPTTVVAGIGALGLALLGLGRRSGLVKIGK